MARVKDSAEIARMKKLRMLTLLSGPAGRASAPRRASAAEPDRLNSLISVSATSRPSEGDAAPTTMSSGSSAANAWPASAIPRSKPSNSTKRSRQRRPSSTAGRSGTRASMAAESMRAMMAGGDREEVTRDG